MSAGLLKKVLAGEALTDVQKADLAVYYQRYIDQNGSFDLNSLQGIGPDQAYGFPYAGLSSDKRAYSDANFTSGDRIFGRDKTVNDVIYNDALIKAGLDINRTEDLLPSSMQWRSFFALNDALISSPLASLGYIGATAIGMSEENRQNIALTFAAIQELAGVATSHKTGVPPRYSKPSDSKNLENDGKSLSVAELPRVGSATKTDGYHGFNDLVDNFSENGASFDIPTKGPGGVVIGTAKLKQVEGSYKGVDGVFEWIIDSDKVAHRRFIPGGKITGYPNQNPKKEY
ncbi:hypothetical protein [Xanthomonas oryzae]|uniref:hypothetical protein n=1 Tax=Xanthomonas oryzae TaxID=347 RepID=UPI002DF393D8|nr:hypothetical protein [Xanthomonas oryzae pv. oryzicola]MEC5115591.1 hypothetical protein [Xanthomonas oryzae pv. oryzicola]